MKVKLLFDYNVRLSANTVVDVDAREAERLRAFNVAEVVKEEKKPKKKKGE